MALDESRSKRTNPKARMPRRTSGFTILLVVLAVCVLAMFGYLLWPSQEAVVTPSPSPPPVAASPSPIPPTSEQDIAAAKEAYADYHAARRKLVTSGSTLEALQAMKEFTTDTAWQYERDEAKANRKNKYKYKGKPSIIIMDAARRGNRVVVLSVCIDQSERTAKAPNGSKVNLPKWVSSKARMKRVGETWKLADRDDKIEDGSCV